MAHEVPLTLPAAGSSRALVLDTNIVLDLLVFADPATAPLPGLMASGRLRWIATDGMRAELARVLAYAQIAPRVQYYGLTSAAVLARFDAAAHIVETAARTSAICKDPDDQQFIDLAVAHRALLLSKDKAVLQLRKRLAVLGVELGCAMATPVSAEPKSGDARLAPGRPKAGGRGCACH